MPKNVTVYKVFLASPSDVEEERKVVDKVISTYNQMHSSDNLKLELVCWENASFPSFGDYAQDVINSQIGDDYDIFIGILWTRFGTATAKYGSGTEEEFERAYQRYSSGECVKMMIYRKDENVPPSKINPTQLQLVNDFILKIGDLGGYYFTFKSSNEFSDILLQHLDKTVKQVVKDYEQSSPKTLLVSNTVTGCGNEICAERVNWGVLDYSEYISAKLSSITPCIELISQMTVDIGNRVRQNTCRLNSSGSNGNYLHVKSIFLNVAKDMNKYATNIDEPNDAWYAGFVDMQQAIKEMLDVSAGFVSDKEWESILDSMRMMSSRMDGTYGAMREMYSSVNKLPKVVQQLNVAKNNLCNKLKKVMSNLKEGKRYCEETISYIEDVIHPISD